MLTLIFVILLAFKLYWDYVAKNEKKRVINHALSAFLDSLVYLAAIYVLQLSLGWLIVLWGCRWLFFDLFFNLLNGDAWDHYGSTSKLDIFMTKQGNFHILIKLAVIFLGLIIVNFLN